MAFPQKPQQILQQEREQQLSVLTKNDCITELPSIVLTEEEKEARFTNPPQNPTIGNKLIRKITARKSTAEVYPVDCGARAWLACLLGHLMTFCTLGLINSFGLFQTYYTTILAESRSNISWIGSIQLFLLFFMGVFSGRLMDAGYFHQILAVGTFLLVFGLFMLSLATEYWQILLSQGLCVGLGSGTLFSPVVALVATYFKKDRALAIGLVASGCASGGMVFSAIVQQLLPKIGFPWTIRIIAFMVLAIMLVVNLWIKPRLILRKGGPLFDYKAFTELPYILFTVGMFFVSWGTYFAFFYVGSYGRDIIGINYAESVNLIIIINGVGFLGRAIPCYAADHFTSPMVMLLPFTVIAALLMFAWIAVSDSQGLYAFDVLYGFFSAGIQGLFPAAMAGLTVDLKKIGARSGMIFTIVSFACLTGPPIAGALIKVRDGGYLYAQVFAGASLLFGFLCLLGAQLNLLRQRKKDLEDSELETKF